MGKRRIEIKKIEEKSKRQVCFTKRRNGLFKKAAELCALCDAHIAVITFSAGGKPFAFCHPNVDSVLRQYLGQPEPPPATSHPPHSALLGRIFELEQRMHQSPANGSDARNWWDVASARDEELQLLKDALEGLRKKVLLRLENVSVESAASASAASVVPLQVREPQYRPLIAMPDEDELFFNQLPPIDVGGYFL